MLQAFTIGPFLVPTWPVVVVLSLVFAVAAAHHAGKRANLDAKWVRGVAEGSAWLGLLGARAGYVIAHWSAFQEQPWTAFYFWQPGYLVAAGVALGLAYSGVQLKYRISTLRGRYLGALAGGYLAGAVVLGAAVLVLHAAVPPGSIRSGQDVPDFTLVDLRGETVSLSDLRGRAVVLNFWATWCPPCRREMPLLDNFQSRYGPRGLTVVGVALDEPVTTVAPFIAAMGVKYPIWVDAPEPRAGHASSRGLFERFAGVGLPTTVFIRKDGRVLDVHVGELTRALLEERAQELLFNPP